MGLEILPGDAWLEQDVDILIPAALENQITADNVGKISKRVKIAFIFAPLPVFWPAH